MTAPASANRIYALLKEAGYRWTKPRRVVSHLLLKSHKPLSIEEIHAQVGDDTINRVSVYRTVQVFCALGIARRLQFQEGFARYELADSFGTHHHHFICNECGRVEDVETCPLASTERAIARRTHSRITSHSLEFYGLCGNCSQPTRASSHR